MKQQIKNGIEITELDGYPLTNGQYFYWDAAMHNIVMEHVGNYLPNVDFKKESNTNENKYTALFHRKSSQGAELCGTSVSLEKKGVKLPESELDSFINALNEFHKQLENNNIPEDTKDFIKSFRVPNPLSMKSAWRVTNGFTRHLLVLWGYAASDSNATVLPLTETSQHWTDAGQRVDLREKVGLHVSKGTFNWKKLFKYLLWILLLVVVLFAGIKILGSIRLSEDGKPLKDEKCLNICQIHNVPYVNGKCPECSTGGTQKSDSGKSDSGNSDSGNSDSGNSDSGNSDSGNSDSGNSDSGNSDSGNSGSGNSGSGNSGNGNVGRGKDGTGNSGNRNGDSGNVDSGKDGTGNAGSGNGDSGNVGRGKDGTGNAGTGNAGSGNGDSGNVGSGKDGTGNGDSGNVGRGKDGTGAAGSGKDGTGDAGTGNSDSGNAGSGNSGNGNVGSGNGGTGNGGTNNHLKPSPITFKVLPSELKKDEKGRYIIFSVPEGKRKEISNVEWEINSDEIIEER